MHDRSKCVDCRCDLLASAKNNPAPGFVAAIQFVHRETGKHVSSAGAVLTSDLKLGR
jgi:hypothetical protein